MVAVLVSTMPNPNNHFDGINYLQMCILYLQYMRVSCVRCNYMHRKMDNNNDAESENFSV